MSKLQFNSFTKNIDGQEYCSEVETLAENMIESNEQDATIVYPASGQWATFRAENFRLTTDSLAIVLPYPIYKIKSLKIKPFGVKVWGGGGTTYEFFWEDFKDADGNYAVLDIAPYLIQPPEWNALKQPNRTGTYKDHVAEMYQSNTFTYEQGSKTIKIRSDAYKYRNGEYAAFIGIVAIALVNLKDANKFVSYKYDKDPYKERTLEQALEYDNPIGAYPQDGHPKTWEFQIEYVPMTSATKMKAHKAEATEQAYTQVINQRAEVNNAEAFGRYLHLTAQKTGTEKLAIAKIYTKLEDVPPIGSVVKHNGERYRLIANSWNITNPHTFTITHLLSKNWSSKSKHISVDQKYRNWAIPFDSYIWRTIYSEAFVSIGENETAGGVPAFDSRKQCIKDMFSTATQEVKPLRNLFFYGKAKGEGVVVPTTTMAIGNSFIISATMQDNLSAGLRVSAEDSEFCEEVLYCNEDGTLDSATVVLSQELLDYDAAAYPAIIGGDEPKNHAGKAEFQEKLYIDKDPGEALKMTIQTHFLPNADWVVVGNGLAQNVPYIADKQRKLKLYALKKYIRDGVEKLDAETLTDAHRLVFDNGVKLLYSDLVYKKPIGIGGEGVFDPTTWTDFVYCNGSALSFNERITDFFDKYSGYKAWAITDENDNLLIGSNDISKREVYFNWTKKRSRKA